MPNGFVHEAALNDRLASVLSESFGLEYRATTLKNFILTV